MLIELTFLRKHPKNTEIYGNENEEGSDDRAEIVALSKLIKEHGLQRPIVVTPLDNDLFRVISGHRRVAAHKILGLTHIEAEIRRFDTPHDEEIFLVLENKYRTKKKSQLIKEAEILYKELKGSTDGGRAIEKVADQVGVSVGSIHNGMKALEGAKKLESQGKTEEAKKIIETMDTKGINAAVRAANEAIGAPKPVKEELTTYWNQFSAAKSLVTELTAWKTSQKNMIRDKYGNKINISAQVLFRALDIFIAFVGTYTKAGGTRCPVCDGYGLIAGNEHCDHCYEGRVGKGEL